MGRVGNRGGDFSIAAGNRRCLPGGVEAFQALPGGRQRFLPDFAGLERLCCAVEGAEILVRIVGNEDQVDAGGERFAGHPADAVLIDGAHVEIVGDQDAGVAPVAAQQAGNHGGRVRGGVRRVDAVQRDMAEHDRGCRLPAQSAEGQPVGRQRGWCGGEAGGLQVGVLAHLAETGEMLQCRAHTVVAQAGDVAVGDFADQQRIGRDGTGADVGQHVVGDGPLRAQIDDRAEIEIDAEPRQAGALFLAIATGPLVQAAAFPLEQTG